jgi:tetratricopeptide (TPR) repeat protein/transcriptional regulator with XRE-family HTH domain
VAEHRAVSFAELLRRLRTDAGFTQEELAGAAHVSHRSISDLERGIHQTARKDTARLLADALNLAGAARAAFEAAALGRQGTNAEGAPRPPGELARSVAATTPTLPHDIRSFTGRQPELAQLMSAAADDSGVVGIYAIDGMAGVGKSAFAVHAAHLIEHSFPDGQIFLSLHAHTAGQRPVDPADALASLLLTIGVAADQIPAGLSERTGLWRSHLAGKRMLLLLDDAAGSEQVRPLLPGTPGCLVLVTSRRHLSALDDATSICLETLPSDEAAALLIRLADRLDLDPEDPAVAEINRLCGYLPLAIGMLARQLHHHPAWTLAGLAEDLAAARDRLGLMHAENLSVAATFDMSYQDLHDDQQRLFRRLGLHPGTDVDAYAAAALDGTGVPAARRGLNELFDQHLVTEPASGRYSMHDLIREHARALAATDDPQDRDSAIGKLIEYYVNAASMVGRHFNRGAAVASDASAVLPQPATLDEAARWMEAERANMHAVVDYTALRKWPRPGIAIAAAMSGFLRTHGHWTQLRVLHLTALDTAHQADYQDGEVGTLTRLGIVYRLTGDYEAASATLTRAIELSIGLENRAEQAAALVALGVLQRLTVNFTTAAATLNQAREQYQGSGDQLGEADALNELGYVQQLAGNYPDATSSHKLALGQYRDMGDQFGQADSLRYLGMVYQEIGDYEAVISSYETALELYQNLNDRLGEAHTLRDLGVAQHVSDNYAIADDTMTKALELYRGLGHRLGQAETLNNLGDLHSLSDPIRARDYHEQALSIARGISVLLEQARALEGIGNSDIQNNELEYGGMCLRQALEIFLRIGSPRAGRVEGTLTFHGL